MSHLTCRRLQLQLEHSTVSALPSTSLLLAWPGVYGVKSSRETFAGFHLISMANGWLNAPACSCSCCHCSARQTTDERQATYRRTRLRDARTGWRTQSRPCRQFLEVNFIKSSSQCASYLLAARYIAYAYAMALFSRNLPLGRRADAQTSV